MGEVVPCHGFQGDGTRGVAVAVGEISERHRSVVDTLGETRRGRGQRRCDRRVLPGLQASAGGGQVDPCGLCRRPIHGRRTDVAHGVSPSIRRERAADSTADRQRIGRADHQPCRGPDVGGDLPQDRAAGHRIAEAHCADIRAQGGGQCRGVHEHRHGLRTSGAQHATGAGQVEPRHINRHRPRHLLLPGGGNRVDVLEGRKGTAGHARDHLRLGRIDGEIGRRVVRIEDRVHPVRAIDERVAVALVGVDAGVAPPLEVIHWIAQVPLEQGRKLSERGDSAIGEVVDFQVRLPTPTLVAHCHVENDAGDVAFECVVGLEGIAVVVGCGQPLNGQRRAAVVVFEVAAACVHFLVAGAQVVSVGPRLHRRVEAAQAQRPNVFAVPTCAVVVFLRGVDRSAVVDEPHVVRVARILIRIF